MAAPFFSFSFSPFAIYSPVRSRIAQLLPGPWITGTTPSSLTVATAEHPYAVSRGVGADEALRRRKNCIAVRGLSPHSPLPSVCYANRCLRQPMARGGGAKSVTPAQVEASNHHQQLPMAECRPRGVGYEKTIRPSDGQKFSGNNAHAQPRSSRLHVASGSGRFRPRMVGRPQRKREELDAW